MMKLKTSFWHKGLHVELEIADLHDINKAVDALAIIHKMKDGGSNPHIKEEK